MEEAAEEGRDLQKRETKECYCTLCDWRDKDMKEFYMVRIGGD